MDSNDSHIWRPSQQTGPYINDGAGTLPEPIFAGPTPTPQFAVIDLLTDIAKKLEKTNILLARIENAVQCLEELTDRRTR